MSDEALRGKLRVITSGVLGNVLEWYDFAVYGYFAVAIGQTFFPQSDAVAQVLAAFGVFAVGYVMRPLGGIVTGTIADRYGRPTALTVSILAMAFPTFLVGLLPGYETLGIWAPILLTLLRMIQGLSVGGECTTSFTFLIEQAPPGRKGLIGAIANSGATTGMLLGSGAGTLMASVLTVEELHRWGWRLPFLFGLGVGLVGFALRRGLRDEATSAAAEAARRMASPIVQIYRHHLPLVGRMAGVVAFGAVGFYVMFLYVVSWLQLVDGLAPDKALGINTFSMALMVPVIITAGWLSDRMSGRTILFAAAAAGGLGAVPFLWLMHHPDVRLVALGQIGFVLTVGLAHGVQPTLMVQATPPSIRCTAIALGFNLSYGLLGGLSPLFATWLIHRTGLDLTPALMVVAAALATCIAVTGLATAARAAAARS